MSDLESFRAEARAWLAPGLPVDALDGEWPAPPRVLVHASPDGLALYQTTCSVVASSLPERVQIRAAWS